MATTPEQLARELQTLREAVESMSDARLKAHMLAALEAFDGVSNVPAPVQRATSDSDDTIVATLKAKDVKAKAPRDALFLAVHAILLETGFAVVNASSEDVFPLPADWDANSVNGLFVATYRHDHDPSTTFSLQGLFVGNKFEVYVSDDKNHTYSIELGTENYVSLSASASNAGDLLRDLAALRNKLSPFFGTFAPKRREAAAESRSAGVGKPRSPPPSRGGGQDDQAGAHSPYVIPPVGSGDVFPPGLGGGDASTEVGPNHPLFGRRYDPTRGPVPGARFDPYGPFSIDPQGPPRGLLGGPHPGRPGPAPGFPFGDPNPDHMRMPRDDEMMDDTLGMGGGGLRSGRPGPRNPRGRGSGGLGSDFGQPFGSDHSFF